MPVLSIGVWNTWDLTLIVKIIIGRLILSMRLNKQCTLNETLKKALCWICWERLRKLRHEVWVDCILVCRFTFWSGFGARLLSSEHCGNFCGIHQRSSTKRNEKVSIATLIVTVCHALNCSPCCFVCTATYALVCVRVRLAIRMVLCCKRVCSPVPRW